MTFVANVNVGLGMSTSFSSNVATASAQESQFDQGNGVSSFS